MRQTTAQPTRRVKPRNPYAPAAAARQAGSHRSTTRQLRQQARSALRRELSTAGAERQGP